MIEASMAKRMKVKLGVDEGGDGRADIAEACAAGQQVDMSTPWRDRVAR
jgi:hypothetical protein